MYEDNLFQLKRDILPDSARLTEQPGCLQDVCDCIVSVYGLAELARRQGLLAMEELFVPNAAQPDEPDFRSFIRAFNETYPLTGQLNAAIVDGWFPEHVALFGTSSILRETEPCKKLIKLMILDGMLMIQSGTNPRVMVTILLAMIPETHWGRVEDALRARDHEAYLLWRLSAFKKGLCADVTGDGLYSLIYRTDEENARTVRKLEQVLCGMDDRSIQRMLRDIENNTLVKTLLLLSATAKEAILRNMSGRLRQMIEEDMEKELEDIILTAAASRGTGCVSDILDVYERLCDTGEIVPRGKAGI